MWAESSWHWLVRRGNQDGSAVWYGGTIVGCAPWQAQHRGHGYCVDEGTGQRPSRQRELVTTGRLAPNSLSDAHVTRFKQ